MKDRNVQSRILLLLCLQLTGVWCQGDVFFIYSTVGSKALLPCPLPSRSDCSKISWTYFGGHTHFYEVKEGQLAGPRASRLSLLSNCSLFINNLKMEDVGCFDCLIGTKSTRNVFISILSITSYSQISELQVGGNLVLSCLLVTFFDAGHCGSRSEDFRLNWATGDEAELSTSNRYQLIDPKPCNITLEIKLKKEDNHRKWRCQMITANNSVVKEFTSTFVFHDGSVADPGDVPGRECPVELPISRFVLCAALPLMVITVGVFSWRRDRRNPKVSRSHTEFQEVIECKHM